MLQPIENKGTRVQKEGKERKRAGNLLKTQAGNKKSRKGTDARATEDHAAGVLYECEKKSFAEKDFNGAT